MTLARGQTRPLTRTATLCYRTGSRSRRRHEGKSKRISLLVNAVHRHVVVGGDAIQRQIGDDLCRGFGVRVLSVQHFPVEFGGDGLGETWYLRRADGDGRTVFGRRRRCVMMERVAPAADGRGGHHRSYFRGLTALLGGGDCVRLRGTAVVRRGGVRLRGTAGVRRGGVRLRGTAAVRGGRRCLRASDVLQGRRDRVRLSGARHRHRLRRCHRDGRCRCHVCLEIGRASDVLERRSGGHGCVVHARSGRHADRGRPDGGRPRGLRARVHRLHDRFRGYGRWRPDVGCRLSAHRAGDQTNVVRRGRLSTRDRRLRRCRTSRTPAGAVCTGADYVSLSLFRHGGRVRGQSRGWRRHSHVPTHGHAIDAHVFGVDAPVRHRRRTPVAADT